MPDGKVIEYINDPLGRRIAKKVNGIITEKYLWQGLTRLLAIFDSSDNILMRFIYAGGRMPVAMESGGANYYLAYDQVGTLRLVTDASGGVIKALDYDSFGNIIQDTDPLFDMPFSFAGGMIDTDTGLIRFGFREYCPEIGRWTAKDPILFLGGSSDLYGYCVNDPINWVDKSGLLIQTILMATGHGLWASQEGTGAMIGAVIGTVTGEIVGMAGTEALSFGLGLSLGLLGGEIGHLFDPPEYDEDFELERAETRRVIEEAEEWLKKQHEWADPIARKLKVPVPCP